MPYIRRRILHDQCQSDLFQLPAELRLRIFELAVGGQRCHVQKLWKVKPSDSGSGSGSGYLTLCAKECLGTIALACPPVSPQWHNKRWAGISDCDIDWRREQAAVMRGEIVSSELRPHRFCGLPAVMRPVDNLGLLRSCRAAYAEARNMLYSQNVFAFDDIGHFISWANGLEASALREIRRLEAYTVFSGREPGWNDLAAVFKRMRPSIQLSVVGEIPSALKDRLELTLGALSNADASCAAAEVIYVPYKGHRGSADATGVGDDNAGIQAFNPVDEGPAEHDDILIMGE